MWWACRGGTARSSRCGWVPFRRCADLRLGKSTISKPSIDWAIASGNYAHIEVQTVLLGGGRKPDPLGKRLDALEAVLPHSERVVMERRDHSAQARAPREVAQVIENLADSVFG